MHAPMKFLDELDAQPRTLHVKRELVNTDPLVVWAREAGLGSLVQFPNVVLIHSHTAISWLTAGNPPDAGAVVSERGMGDLTLPVLRLPPHSAREITMLGDALILELGDEVLLRRRRELMDRGATNDSVVHWPFVELTRKPHVGLDISKIMAPRIALDFGPEIFDEASAFDQAPPPPELSINQNYSNLAEIAALAPADF